MGNSQRKGDRQDKGEQKLGRKEEKEKEGSKVKL